MGKLNSSELARKLAALPEWKIEGGQLTRTFVFRDFRQAIAFVNRIAETAEAAQHHPDIHIRFNKIFLQLTTHDAGGLTEKDTALAAEADRIAAEPL